MGYVEAAAAAHRRRVATRGGRFVEAVVILAAGLALAACASSPQRGVGSPGQQHGKLRVVDIGADDFARTVESVLLDRAPADRLGMLTSLVRYQLKHAEWLFQTGHDEAGLGAVSGAFYLVRAGEFRPEMIQGHELALRYAVGAVSQVGNEGRARALYAMLDRILPAGPDHDDVQAHLKALSEWQHEALAAGGMQATGAEQKSAVDRALLEPTEEAYRAARDSTLRWINQARAFSGEQRQPPQTSFERDEWLEAYRAVRTGALTLAALSLRYRDAAGGIDVLEQANVAPVVPPNMHDTLVSAERDHSQEAWADLFSVFEGGNDGSADHAEPDLDADLARGAAWGVAIELYRTNPSSLRTVIPLASLLIAHQMTDVATLLLADGLGKTPDPRELGWSLHMITQALNRLETLGDLTTARAVFANMRTLLPYAKTAGPELRAAFVGVHFVMGEMESRSGELGKAREQIVESVRLQPTFEALRLLVAIDRQGGKVADVIQSLKGMLALSEQAKDAASEAETQILLFEVYRELGQQDDARVALEAGLRGALKARSAATSSADQANAERILARALEQYGDVDGARRATERAFDASEYDARQFAATVLDSARRALTVLDLSSARAAVRRAIDGQVEEQDLVYAALWLELLERQLKASSDGTAEEAFEKIQQRASWPATLRDWAIGKLSNDGLLGAAKTTTQKTEAEFYTAMAARAAAPRKGSGEGLKRVLASDAIDLVEVTIARDLLAKDAGLFKPALPSGVAIP